MSSIYFVLEGRNWRFQKAVGPLEQASVPDSSLHGVLKGTAALKSGSLVILFPTRVMEIVKGTQCGKPHRCPHFQELHGLK